MVAIPALHLVCLTIEFLIARDAPDVSSDASVSQNGLCLEHFEQDRAAT
jgi:hypothetical protein